MTLGVTLCILMQAHKNGIKFWTLDTQHGFDETKCGASINDRVRQAAVKLAALYNSDMEAVGTTMHGAGRRHIRAG